MKKLVYLLGLALISLTLINSSSLDKNDEKYPESLPIEYIEAFKTDFIKTVENRSLILTLQGNFHSLFDRITYVDAQFNANSGYYYLVSGTKDNIKKIELLKITKSDMDNEAYTYINFSKIDTSVYIQYCREGNGYPFPPVCQGGCEMRTDGCLGITCGVWNGSECVNQ